MSNFLRQRIPDRKSITRKRVIEKERKNPFDMTTGHFYRGGEHFKYLGATLSKEDTCSAKIQISIATAMTVMAD